ncbi:hypothetical protein ACOJR9_07915 [Alteromonas sp. A081]|uniref:hypothetical protein n=1 Tax=Alteromonas sp. A081 TaxID=3410269 RepID=UPI003B9836DE
MRNSAFLSFLVSIVLLLSPVAQAQEASVAPGTQVRGLLINEVEAGADLITASSKISEAVLTEGLYFDAEGLAYLQQNRQSYESMVTLLNENASGFEITIAGLDSMPEIPTQVVTIAMIFFPESADEIYGIASQMGMLSEDDALLAAINAGIDPSTLTATAAGADGNNVSPLGVGTGAAGAGGGDTTVSAN